MEVFMGPDFSEKNKIKTNKQTNKIGNNVPSLCKWYVKNVKEIENIQ